MALRLVALRSCRLSRFCFFCVALIFAFSSFGISNSFSSSRSANQCQSVMSTSCQPVMSGFPGTMMSPEPDAAAGSAMSERRSERATRGKCWKWSQADQQWRPRLS